MTVHEIKFKVLTNCETPTVQAFTIEISERPSGTVLETITEASLTTAIAGVSLTSAVAGGLPSFNADDTLIPSNLRWEFVDFTTPCGTEVVNDRFDLVQAGAPADPGPEDTGCITGGGVLQIQSRDAVAGSGVHSSNSMIGINAEGRIFGNGNNSANGFGQLGLQGASQPSTGRDTNYWNGRAFSATDVNVFFANIEHHLPGVRFAQVEADSGNNRFLARATDGRLYGWGAAAGALTDRTFLGPGGAGTATTATVLIPVEILSPTGDPWDDVYMTDISTAIYVRGLSGGVWYGWGTGGNLDLGGLGIQNSGNPAASGAATDVFTPTPLAYPTPPQTGLRHGPFALGFRQTVRNWHIGNDGQIRWYGLGLANTDEYGFLNGATTYNGLVYTLNGEPNNECIQLVTNTTFSAALGASGRVYILAQDNSAAPFAGGTGPASGVFTPTFEPMSDGVKPAGVSIVEIVCNDGGMICGLGDDGIPYVAGRNSTGWETMGNEPDLVDITSVVGDGEALMVFNKADGAFVRGFNFVEPSQQLTHQSSTRLHALATSPTWAVSSDAPDRATRVC